MSAELKAFNAKVSNHALAGKSLPKKLKILSWGVNETNSGDVILNDDTMEVFEEYQKKAGREKDVPDRKSTRLNSSHITRSRMPSSA